MRASGTCHWDVLDVFQRSHARLWNLYLDLVADARFGIAPIIWRDESTGSGCGQHCLANLIGGRAQLSGHHPIHPDIHCGILKRFLVLKIPQFGNSEELCSKPLRKRGYVCILRSGGRNLDDRWSTEAEGLADEIARVEREAGIGKLLRQVAA